jgi:hypothetical protein
MLLRSAAARMCSHRGITVHCLDNDAMPVLNMCAVAC